MKYLLTVLVFVLICQHPGSAQGLYRTGDTGRNPGRGWFPNPETERKMLSGLKHIDPHSQEASDWLWDLADFYSNGSLYEKEIGIWKRYIKVYDDPRWTTAERLKEQSFTYSAIGSTYASLKKFDEAEKAHQKAVELGRLAAKGEGETVLQTALFYQCKHYISVRKPQESLKTYNEFMVSWRKHPWNHPSDLRPGLLALGLSTSVVKEK